MAEGGRRGSSWEGPSVRFQLLAAFSFSTEWSEEVSSSLGMTHGSHTAKAPPVALLLSGRIPQPLALPAPGFPVLGSDTRRSCHRASSRPGAGRGAAFPGPPPLGALGTRRHPALCELRPGRSPARRRASPGPRTALPSRPRPGNRGFASRHAPTSGPPTERPQSRAVLRPRQQGTPFRSPARVPIPPNSCGCGRPRVGTHGPAGPGARRVPYAGLSLPLCEWRL